MVKDEAEAYKQKGKVSIFQSKFLGGFHISSVPLIPLVLSDNEPALQLGNKLFAEHRYEDAIKEYSTAIVRGPWCWERVNVELILPVLPTDQRSDGKNVLHQPCFMLPKGKDEIARSMW